MIREVKMYSEYIKKMVDCMNDAVQYADIFLDMTYAGVTPVTKATREVRDIVRNIKKFQQAIISESVDLFNEITEERRKKHERFFIANSEGQLEETSEEEYRMQATADELDSLDERNIDAPHTEY